eukprot:99661_1
MRCVIRTTVLLKSLFNLTFYVLVLIITQSMGTCQCPQDVRQIDDWRMLCFDSSDNPDQTCTLNSYADASYYWLLTYGCNENFKWTYMYEPLGTGDDYTFRCATKYGNFNRGTAGTQVDDHEDNVCCVVPCDPNNDAGCWNLQSEKSPWYQNILSNNLRNDDSLFYGELSVILLIVLFLLANIYWSFNLVKKCRKLQDKESDTSCIETQI